MKKSKRQKTTAWILLGSGVAITTFVLTANKELNIAVLIELPLGLGLAIARVPFFNGSVLNRHKAMTATAYFKFEKAQSFQQSGINFLSYPSLAIKINLQRKPHLQTAGKLTQN